MILMRKLLEISWVLLIQGPFKKHLYHKITILFCNSKLRKSKRRRRWEKIDKKCGLSIDRLSYQCSTKEVFLVYKKSERKILVGRFANAVTIQTEVSANKCLVLLKNRLFSVFQNWISQTSLCILCFKNHRNCFQHPCIGCWKFNPTRWCLIRCNWIDHCWEIDFMMSIVSTATQPDYVLPCPSSRRLPPFLRVFLIVKLEFLEHGNLLDEQNCGKSLPSFKNGDTENFSKIRPLTSVCFKFFEKIVVLKLDFFFKEHSSVDKHQNACKNNYKSVSTPFIVTEKIYHKNCHIAILPKTSRKWFQNAAGIVLLLVNSKTVPLLNVFSWIGTLLRLQKVLCW